MPGLIVLVNQHLQEAKKEYEARECSSDGLADKHRKKISVAAVFLDDAHSQELFAWGCPLGTEE